MESLLQFGLSNAAAATLLAIFVSLITRLWKNPHIAHAFWLIVLLRLVAPPLVPISLRTPDWLDGRSAPSSLSAPSDALPANPPDESRGEGGLPILTPSGRTAPAFSLLHTITRRVQSNRLNPSPVPTAPEQSIAKPIRISNVLGTLWIAGTVLYVGMASFRVRRFSRAMRRSRCDLPIALRDELLELAKSIGLRRVPRLAVVEGPLPPMVWSGLRPTVVLPRMIVESLDSSARRLLLLHELVHIRRQDHLMRWFEMAVLSFYWWNPIAWRAVRRLQQAEEECCDAAVLSLFPNDARHYGETLLATCEFLTRRSVVAPVLSSGFGREKHLKRRLTMIMDDRRWQKLSRTGLLVVAAFGGLMIAVSWNLVAAQNEPKARSNNPADPAEPAISRAASGGAVEIKSDPVTARPLPPNGEPKASPKKLPVDSPRRVKPSILPQPATSATDATKPVLSGVRPIPYSFYVNSEPQAAVKSYPEKNQISAGVRDQVFTKLWESLNDPDRSVAGRSLEGLVNATDPETALQLFQFFLSRSADTQEEELRKLLFAHNFYRRYVGNEQVYDRYVEFLLKMATSEHRRVVRQVIGILSEIEAGNQSAAVVLQLVAIYEKSRQDTNKPVATFPRVESALQSRQSREIPTSQLAIQALMKIVPKADDVAFNLMQAMDHKDAEIRGAAATALSNVFRGSDQEALRSHMQKLLNRQEKPKKAGLVPRN